jgi:hypothetical protein
MSFKDKALQAASDAALRSQQTADDAAAHIKQLMLDSADKWFRENDPEPVSVAYNATYEEMKGEYGYMIRVVRAVEATWTIEGYEFKVVAGPLHQRSGGAVDGGFVKMKFNGTWHPCANACRHRQAT